MHSNSTTTVAPTAPDTLAFDAMSRSVQVKVFKARVAAREAKRTRFHRIKGMSRSLGSAVSEASDEVRHYINVKSQSLAAWDQELKDVKRECERLRALDRSGRTTRNRVLGLDYLLVHEMVVMVERRRMQVKAEIRMQMHDMCVELGGTCVDG